MLNFFFWSVNEFEKLRQFLSPGSGRMNFLTPRKWISNLKVGIKEDSDHTKAKVTIITTRTLQGM